MYARSYLQSALRILDAYDGKRPLAAWLKEFFTKEKKYGSRDRKYIAHLCYCYFRLGRSFAHAKREERLVLSLFLCSDGENEMLQQLAPEWNALSRSGIVEKFRFLGADGETANIFSFAAELSNAVDAPSFALSHLVQPDLYLRVRPQGTESVKQKLHEARVRFRVVLPDCLALPNGTKVDAILALDREAVVQDKSSQQTLEPLIGVLPADKNPHVWDCCTASGGKSILLMDRAPACSLTVSDVRESILVNLRKRFQRAGISGYRWFVADLTATNLPTKDAFDAVICDAPCSGSGTWSRTPEWLCFFNERRLDEYAMKQRKIIARAEQNLRRGGYLLYITCSVFKKENEDAVEYAQRSLPLRLQSMRYVKGYNEKADTLFTALFKKL